jgi:DNA repair protein RadC
MKLPKLTPSATVLNGGQYDELEQKLEALQATYVLRQVDITFKGGQKKISKISSTQDVYRFIRATIIDSIEVQERFIVLFLNHANSIIGYYHHAAGGMTSIAVDVQLITAAAVRCLARGVIVAHNHPSGNTKPSSEDRNLTAKLKKALDLFHITLVDHLVVTHSNGFYSFLENGEPTLNGLGSPAATKPTGIPYDEHLEEKIIAIVDGEIDKLTPVNSPELYALIQQKGGREQLRDRIIRKMIGGNLIVQAAIPQLESDLNMM